MGKVITIGGGFFLVVLSIFMIKPKMSDYQIEKQGVLVAMEIIRLPRNCIGTKTNHFVTFRYGSESFIKKVGPGFCEEHNVGEQIEMRYLDGHNNVLFPGETVVSEFVALFLLALIGAIIFVKGLYS